MGPWGTIALIGAVVAVVTATSDIMEFERDGAPIAWQEPVLWEATSAVSVILLAPLIGLAVRRWPPNAEHLARFGLVHIGLTAPFSLAHVLAIWVTREVAYWLAGARYGFFDDGVALTLLYEWRKDVLTYAAIAAVYLWFERRDAKLPSAPAPIKSRIEIRDGGSAFFLPPGDLLFVEAAGNYVQLHTAARTHLIRGTLAAWEAELTVHGFVRVHRSRLVNRARIAAIKPTPAGDVEIVLDTGRTLAGSRRYRDALDAPA